MSMRFEVLSLGSWLIVWNCILIAGLLPVSGYISRLGAVVCGTAILGFGISLSVAANVIMNSGEAFVKAVSDVSGKEFGNVKIIFDISNVTFAAVLSLILFDFKIVGLREGTVIAAVFTGICVKFFTRLFKEKLDRMLSDNTEKRDEISAEKS